MNHYSYQYQSGHDTENSPARLKSIFNQHTTEKGQIKTEKHVIKFRENPKLQPVHFIAEGLTTE